MNEGNHPYIPEPQKPDHDQWQAFALCREVDPELMHPEARNQIAVQAAKRICNMCVVRDQCLDTHLNEQYGVWGGASERERKRIRIARIGLHLITDGTATNAS